MQKRQVYHPNLSHAHHKEGPFENMQCILELDCHPSSHNAMQSAARFSH